MESGGCGAEVGSWKKGRNSSERTRGRNSSGMMLGWPVSGGGGAECASVVTLTAGFAAGIDAMGKAGFGFVEGWAASPDRSVAALGSSGIGTGGGAQNRRAGAPTLQR